MAESLPGIIKAAENLGKVVDAVMKEVPVSGNYEEFRDRLEHPTALIIYQAGQLQNFPRVHKTPRTFTDFRNHLEDLVKIIGSTKKTLTDEQKENIYSAIRIIGEEIEKAFPGRAGLVDEKILEAGFSKKPIAVVEAARTLQELVDDFLNEMALDSKNGVGRTLTYHAGSITAAAKKLKNFEGETAPKSFGDFEDSLLDLLGTLNGKHLAGEEWKVGKTKPEILTQIRSIGQLMRNDFPNWRVNEAILYLNPPDKGWKK